MDRFPQYHFGLLFVQTATMGAFIIVYPYCGTLPLLFAAAFVSGSGQGALDAGCNMACLNIWRGREGAPYMHSIHFSFGLGAFLAPVAAAPFLRDGDRESNIGTYYPIVGLATIFVSLGFLYFGSVEIKKGMRKHKTEEQLAEQAGADKANIKDHVSPKTRQTMWEKLVATPWEKVLIIVLLSIFFFVYVGIETDLGYYLPSFSVYSELKLTRVQGSHVAAIFWGVFTLARLLAIPASAKLSPDIVMWGSLV